MPGPLSCLLDCRPPLLGAWSACLANVLLSHSEINVTVTVDVHGGLLSGIAQPYKVPQQAVDIVRNKHMDVSGRGEIMVQKEYGLPDKIKVLISKDLGQEKLVVGLEDLKDLVIISVYHGQLMIP